MNNLIYFRGILVWSVIVIVSWAVGNNLVNVWGILAGPIIVIASWAVGE